MVLAEDAPLRDDLVATAELRHHVSEDSVVHDGGNVVDRRGNEDREHGAEQQEADGGIAVDLTRILTHIPAHRRYLAEEKNHEKQQCRQRTRTGTDGTTRGTEGIAVLLTLVEDIRRLSTVKQDARGEHRDGRIDDLLENLRDRRRHHVAAALEVATQDTEVGHEPDRRCQRPEREGAERFLQEDLGDGIRTEPEGTAHRSTGDGRIEKGGTKHAGGVPVLSVHEVRRDDLRHRGRHGKAAEDQQECIDTEGTGVVAISFIADDRRERHPVYHTDDAHDDACDGEEGALHDKVVPAVLPLLLAGGPLHTHTLRVYLPTRRWTSGWSFIHLK